MKKTILDLWNGNNIPVEHSGNENENIKATVGMIERSLNNVKKTLNDEQVALLHDLIDHYEDYLTLVAE